jgi:dTDP-4-dehydrorhamnose reductase
MVSCPSSGSLNQATKVLVFGKDGQVGRALQECFKHLDVPVVFLGREDCDLSNEVALNELLNHYQPQIIINASAYTAVDLAENERDLTFAINCQAVKLMAQHVANVSNGVFLHFSTDYVYSGLKKEMYLESDLPEPASVYGQSKLAGELEIIDAFDQAFHAKNSSSRYYILRTSWVYGDGGNFIRTMLRLAAERDVIKVVADQCGAPTSADWLATVAIQMVDSKVDSGIFHAVPDGQTSWHGLAKFVIEFARELGQKIEVKSGNVLPIGSSEYPLVAPRPKNSCMDNSKLKQALSEAGSVNQFPSWQDQVLKYVENFVRNSLKS